MITFKVSSEPVNDAMQLRINGKLIKSFAGSEDWQTYAYAISADGEYEAEIVFTLASGDRLSDDFSFTVKK